MNLVSNLGKKLSPMSNLLRYAKNQKYLCFDFETCGLNLVDPNNKPWQLSYLISEGTNIVDRSDNFIWWEDLKISAEAALVTRFNFSLYKEQAKDPAPILEEFDKLLYDDSYLIIGQNVIGFDIYIHNIYRKLMGKKPDFSYLDRVIDTNCLARAIKKNFRPQPDEKLITWQYKLAGFREKGLKTSSKVLLKEYNIEFDENKLHDSMYDVEMTFKIFNKQIWELDI